ncbi:MAG: proteasome accessory factor PafA2 family protein [Fimbriimonadaceae bacterium]|nr:proteasome accessory factor PafA2 family protein [Fimbriimonadaceae bacterium]
MRPILAGLDTEYGLSVEGRTPFEQVQDSRDFVATLHPHGFAGWDLRDEAPRADLRGYEVESLSVDPEDAAYDQPGSTSSWNATDRADVVLPNGARFYNDHGHPEYATPECLSGVELAIHDRAGDAWLRRAMGQYREAIGKSVHVFKNNIDSSGATWGAHESYLMPRDLGFDSLYTALAPLLVTRCILTGAGTISDSQFQMSQRADHFSVRASVDTLFKRPIFNTRDEPHARRGDWVRVHVITGDANMMPGCVARKVNLVKIALALAEIGQAPKWPLHDPVVAFRAVSRAVNGDARIELEGGNWTTARFILESYLLAAQRHFDQDDPVALELLATADECLALLELRDQDPVAYSQRVEWAAKRRVIETYLDSEEESLSSPLAKSLDLSWHDLDPDEGLYPAIHDAGWVEEDPAAVDVALRMKHVTEPTRAFPRSLAVTKFRGQLSGVSWGRLVFGKDEVRNEVLLAPERLYSESLDAASDVETFIQHLEAT